eukprot:scaffold1424_cov359-Prasinococcus_capsulatus_cf.AAC.1
MKAPWPPAPPLAPRHEPAPLQIANPRGQGTRRRRALQGPRPTQQQGHGLPGACLPPAANPRASQDGGFARETSRSSAHGTSHRAATAPAAQTISSQATQNQTRTRGAPHVSTQGPSQAGHSDLNPRPRQQRRLAPGLPTRNPASHAQPKQGHPALTLLPAGNRLCRPRAL